ncbi:hypothetical protein PIB30_042171 [Stylosanthes scabra]|uniref:Uncharacterized protein n=1 Tax=Stylosanthes scabra TaxID=79078 RepID=A0ABU6RF94_9FABA|nr:hypothetical protein [Stylosanthes scabra]
MAYGSEAKWNEGTIVDVSSPIENQSTVSSIGLGVVSIVRATTSGGGCKVDRREERRNEKPRRRRENDRSSGGSGGVGTARKIQ